MTTPVPVRAFPAGNHTYLSTSCLHGRHDYCAAPEGAVGAKQPAVCKWCPAQCICDCHTRPVTAEADAG